ncbi:fructose-6-phosphate aldolase [Candidatus Aminicenantes bacterium AH-873-B07]|nr:fructose-6-phosphate aldolase [Candidatus Aminicenantes bacterium AH-873-B07]
MKFFLDTANLEQIKEAVSWGVIEGVTTNPTLVSKENMEFEDLIKKICEMVPGPVSVEVISQDCKGMMEEARKLAKLAKNVVIKIPMTIDGLKATKELSKEDIKVNMTLIFSPSQALLAAKAGASYVSPFIGRLDDISTPGMNLIEDIATIFDNYMFNTEIIVASIRHPLHVVEAALLGADIATIPFPVLEKLVNHPLTKIGLEKFLSDWEKVKK